jgi:hypothetical protein
MADFASVYFEAPDPVAANAALGADDHGHRSCASQRFARDSDARPAGTTGISRGAAEQERRASMELEPAGSLLSQPREVNRACRDDVSGKGTTTVQGRVACAARAQQRGATCARSAGCSPQAAPQPW